MTAFELAVTGRSRVSFEPSKEGFFIYVRGVARGSVFSFDDAFLPEDRVVGFAFELRPHKRRGQRHAIGVDLEDVELLQEFASAFTVERYERVIWRLPVQ